MTNKTDPIWLLQQLIRCPSITPHEGGALSFLQKITEELGFTVHRPIFKDQNTADVENLYAKFGTHFETCVPHLMFAGHTDVVPPGDETSWRYPPFSGTLMNDVLYGRGAVDMKGAIACFLAALARTQSKAPLKGKISLLITGDEEAEAINGTVKLLQWASKRGEKWDAALVGEPTSFQTVGDTIKIGRRGSLSGTLIVRGQQGHVAYPHLANNPLPLMIALLDALISSPLDEGNETFQPSNLELTNIDSANKITNLIPQQVEARFNIRFNNLWSIDRLKQEIETRLCQKMATLTLPQNSISYSLSWSGTLSSSFLNQDLNLLHILEGSIVKITGNKPHNSTIGGTSDARFIKDYCPVLECGLVGETMHKIDEAVNVNDLEIMTQIYQQFIEDFFLNYPYGKNIS